MSVELAYLTILGRSSWALLNCYFAVLRETAFRPSEILVITEEIFAPELDPVQKGLSILSEAYHIRPRMEKMVLAEADFHSACTRIPEAILVRKQKGMTIALDVTSGRKALIAGALLGVSRETLDHVFYLAITRTEGAAKPYLMIPLQMQRLRDFRAVTETCGVRS